MEAGLPLIPLVFSAGTGNIGGGSQILMLYLTAQHEIT